MTTPQDEERDRGGPKLEDAPVGSLWEDFEGTKVRVLSHEQGGEGPNTGPAVRYMQLSNGDGEFAPTEVQKLDEFMFGAPGGDSQFRRVFREGEETETTGEMHPSRRVFEIDLSHIELEHGFSVPKASIFPESPLVLLYFAHNGKMLELGARIDMGKANCLVNTDSGRELLNGSKQITIDKIEDPVLEAQVFKVAPRILECLSKAYQR